MKTKPTILITGALACLGFLVISLGTGCRRAAKPKNMILITLDTQRSDHIGAYGSKLALTPAIDRMAREGILFENAFSLIPITLPSHASIFFSRPPYLVKTYNNGQAVSRLRQHPSFVNLFRKEGYATAAFVSLGVLGAKFNLNEGFDTYADEFPEDRWYLSAGEVNDRVFPWIKSHAHEKFFLWIHYSDPHDPYSPPGAPNDTRISLNGRHLGDYCLLQSYAVITLDLDLKKGKNQILFEVSNAAQPNPRQFMARFDKLEFTSGEGKDEISTEFSRGWFIRRSEGVFFFKNGATLDITSPKGPRRIKLTLRGKLLLPLEAVRDGYRREVEYMDGEIGRLWDLLQSLGLYDRTAVILVGDHGEGLGEYTNYFGDPHVGHIHFLNTVYTKVPLIIRVPEMPRKGQRRPETATLLDIAPTAAGIMGFKSFSGFRGRNLLKLKGGEKTSVFQETYRPEARLDRFAVLDYPWHLLVCPETGRYEFFNLDKDPGEKTDLASEGRLPVEASALKTKLDAEARNILKDKKDAVLDDKTKEMLKALGYVGGQ